MSYLDPSIVGDEVTVATAALTGVADRIPGWTAAEGHTETALAESVGVAIATAVTALKQTALNAYIGLGAVLQIFPQPESVATTTITLTLTSDQAPIGLVVDAGTQVIASTADGTQIPFVTATLTTIAPAAGTIAGVQIVAIETGPESNGAAGTGDMSSVAGIATLTLDAPSAGGADAEDMTAYAGRITQRVPRLKAIPITVADYAAFALDIAGIDRALPINRFDPAHPSVDSPGELTLICVQPDGTDITSDLVTELLAHLDSGDRPLSVILHTANPARVAVNVVATIRLAEIGLDQFNQPILADPASTVAAAEAAVTAGLDPSQWDADPTVAGGWSLTPRTKLTVFDVSRMIDTTFGVAATVTVTLNGGTSPITLAAPVSLPALGTVTVTVAS